MADHANLLDQRFRPFPPTRGPLGLPLSSRRGALAALSTYPACRPRALFAQRIALAAVRLFGPGVIPGPTNAWAPPMERTTWEKLVARWRSDLGSFDAFAVYHRAKRSGFALILIQRETLLAYVKVREGVASSLREQRVLQAVQDYGPTLFSCPEPLAAGTVDGHSYVATTVICDEPHHPAKEPPLRELTEEISAALGSLERDPGSPEHWRPMHGDLTPWNLRQNRGGSLVLFDWENAAWGPPGADEVLYRVVQGALYSTDGLREGAAREALEYWAGVFDRRLEEPEANPLADSLRATVETMYAR